LRLSSHETLFGLAPGGVYPAITVTSNPVRSYRTLSALPVPQAAIGGLLSAALVVGSRRPGVTWHPAHWSPDFPPPHLSKSNRNLNYNDKAAIVSANSRRILRYHKQKSMIFVIYSSHLKIRVSER